MIPSLDLLKVTHQMKLTVIWNYFQSDTEERLQEEKRRKIEEHEKARARGRTKKKHNDIDPMDPAAYSDIPRYGFVRLHKSVQVQN